MERNFIDRKEITNFSSSKLSSENFRAADNLNFDFAEKIVKVQTKKSFVARTI